MPFTVSHAAAAYPLRRLLGRYAVWSALIIGTAMPDLPYFLPLGVPRRVSHSELGLLYYCLPLGVSLYVLFHCVMKRPLTELLPESTRVRLDRHAFDDRLPQVAWTAVVISILIGAASHLAWDAFTHADAAGVEWVPVLSQPLAHVGDHTVHAHAFLQHASTLFGLAVLGMAYHRWHRRTASTNDLPATLLSPGRRWVARALLVTLPSVWAATIALDALDRSWKLADLQLALGVALIPGLRAFGVGVIAYCLLWQLHRRTSRARDISEAILDR